jgi:tetratricopeptide (TPR) repeat protein
LAKVWVPGGYINYWPVTFTAYWLQSKIWGLNPIGFHLVNIMAHAISALLVWRILVQLRVPGALFAAAIFALHPVNVESVAWISQLKGLLSLLLALVSVLLFLAYERRGGGWRWALAIVTFALSTLAKGMAIPLPVVLLACAWWQRGRIGWRDLLHVLPYFVIGAVMAGTEVWTQHRVADIVVRSDGFLSRAAVAGCAVWFYLGKLIWPLDLCFIYPRWQIDDRDALSYLPGALLVIMLALAWWRRRAWGRPIVMLVVCYVALLLPALGFVNIYFMLYSLVSDHWQYAAMIVPCAVFAGAAATLCRRGLGHRPNNLARPKIVQGCLGVAWLAALAVLTWRQGRMYADSETLYRTTIDRNPACWMAYNNLGNALAGHGQVDEAIAQYRQALKIRPDYVEAHNNLGLALAGRGQVDEAIVHYRKALELKPDYQDAHNNLGLALAGRGQVDEAIAQYRKALEIKPDFAVADINLGAALADRGQVDEAIVQYRKALEINPDSGLAHNNLGLALGRRGQIDEAIAQYRKALEIRPDDVEAHDNLGLALARHGQFDEAIAQYQKALEIKPDDVKAHNNLGAALAGRGQFDQAIAHYRTALKIKPDYVAAHINLGDALAGRGRLDDALVHYRTVLDLASARNDQALADAIRARIRLHQPVAPAGHAP